MARMGRGRYHTDLSVSYESGMVDMVQTYRFLLKELENPRWTQYLEDSAYMVIDRRFNAYMTANREEYKHMFEWGATTAKIGSRLWQTIKIESFVGFDFLPSRKYVPVTLPYTKYRNVFRNKAQVFEEASSVVVAPVQSQYLRWRAGSGSSHGGIKKTLPDGSEEVRHPGPIYVESVGGGKYKNKFENAFLLYWASGGGGTMTEIAELIRTSPEYQFEVSRHKIAGLKRSRTMQKKKAANPRGSNRSRQLAKERYLEIERKLKELGAKF